MPEAQHATTLCGNVLEPCARKCYVRPVMKALCLLNLGSAETQRRTARQMTWKKKPTSLFFCANTAAYEQRLHASSSQSLQLFCIGIMCWNVARKDTTARRKRLAKTWAADIQLRIPHSKRWEEEAFGELCRCQIT